MSVHRHSQSSLRLDRLEATRLLQVFGLSILFHMLLWGGYGLGRKLDLWDRFHLPAWMRAKAKVAVAEPEKQQRKTAPLFVDVTKLLESTQPPKDTLFYSDRNSVAANKDADKDSNMPKVDGSQTQMVKMEDGQRGKFDKLMPAPPKPEAPPKVDPGSLTLAKPDRPRTLRDAMLRNAASQPGRAMKQDGGVSQLGGPQLDAKATGVGAYDRAFIDAVKYRWYDLLDSMSDIGYRQGHVKIEFTLNYKGQITDLLVVENTVTDMLGLLCRRAIEEPSPYETWSREMRLLVGADQRRVAFTFYYN